MKIVLIVGATIAFLGCVAHYFGGTKEMVSTKPKGSNGEKVDTYWFMGFGAWHLVSVDLLMLLVIFLLAAFTDLLDSKMAILNIMGIWMLGWAISWILTLTSKEGRVHLKRLPQWVLFVLLSACFFWAAF